MDKIKTLSAAIRYGSTFIEEVPQFMNGPRCGCAIGTAYLACVDTACQVYPGYKAIFDGIATRFDVPREVVQRVSNMHFDGEKTRAQCADWLEARGY